MSKNPQWKRMSNRLTTYFLDAADGRFVVQREAILSRRWRVKLDNMPWPATTAEPVRWSCLEDAMAAVEEAINRAG